MQQFKSDNDLIFESYQQINEGFAFNILKNGAKIAWDGIKKGFQWSRKAPADKIYATGKAAAIGGIGIGGGKLLSNAGEAIKGVGKAVEDTGEGTKSLLDSTGDLISSYGMQAGIALAGVAAAGIAGKYIYKLLFSSKNSEDAIAKNTDPNVDKLLKSINKLPLSETEKAELLKKCAKEIS